MKPLAARMTLWIVAMPLMSQAVPPSEPSGGVSIEHDPVACMVADRFPQVEASFAPVDGVARARAYFRAAGGAHWYSVEMKRAEGGFTALLPKPRKATTKVEYYLEVLDRGFAPSRTAEHAADVVDGPEGCSNRLLAVAASSARILVTAPPGAPALPDGFSSAGLTSAGAGSAAAAAAVAGTAAAGAAGGGIGTTALVIGGVAAAGGVAVVAAASGGSSGSSGAASAPTPAPTPCTASAAQLQFSMDFAYAGAVSCGNNNRQQVYRLTNSSACTVQARSITRAQTFVCAGTPGSFNETLAVQSATVGPGATVVIRSGPAAGTRSQGFCCPVDPPSACTAVCEISETYTVDTDAGTRSVSHSYVVDPKLAPCVRCPCENGQCGDPNGGHAWIPLGGATRTAGRPFPARPSACVAVPPDASRTERVGAGDSGY
jgi:hypothetical protein